MAVADMTLRAALLIISRLFMRDAIMSASVLKR